MTDPLHWPKLAWAVFWLGVALGCIGLCLKKCAWLCQLVATAEGRQEAMQHLKRIERAEFGSWAVFCRPGTESFAC